MSRLIAITGMRGMGKTTEARKLTSASSRLLILDPHWEYTEQKDRCEVCDSIYQLPDLLERDTFRVIYRPEEEYEDFKYIGRLIFFLHRCSIIVEEAEEFYLSRIPPEFRSA